MKKALLASIVACAIPLAAFAQSNGMKKSLSDPTTSDGAPMSDSNTMAAPGATMLSAQDKSFIKQAAMAGLAEVTDGQLAEQMGDSAVMKIGKRMVKDHSKANDELAALSEQLGDPAPTQTDAKDMAMTASLQNLSGDAFDTKYLKDQSTAHEKAIALFNQEISSGSNPALIKFAQTTLPVLEEHLSMIKSAEQSS